MSGPRSSAELWGPRIVIALLRLLPKTCDQLLLWPITLGDRVEIPFSCFGGLLSAVSKSIVATTASLWSSRRHLHDWTIPIPESRNINMKSIQNVWIFVSQAFNAPFTQISWNLWCDTENRRFSYSSSLEIRETDPIFKCESNPKSNV